MTTTFGPPGDSAVTGTGHRLSTLLAGRADEIREVAELPLFGLADDELPALVRLVERSRRWMPGESAVLDLGMSRRLFDRYQRLALADRDQGCVWRGCSRPLGWCGAHHVRPWSTGGPTDLANGALVCRSITTS